MDIRKISIGPDYKSGAMHYIVGQPVLNGTYAIHLIKFDIERESILIYIINDGGISNSSCIEQFDCIYAFHRNLS